MTQMSHEVNRTHCTVRWSTHYITHWPIMWATQNSMLESLCQAVHTVYEHTGLTGETSSILDSLLSINHTRDDALPYQVIHEGDSAHSSVKWATHYIICFLSSVSASTLIGLQKVECGSADSCPTWGTFVLFCFFAFPHLNALQVNHIWLRWAVFYPLESNESWGRERDYSESHQMSHAVHT